MEPHRMILGHFGLALAAKRLAPRTSAGTTTAAAQLLDLVWPVLVILGVEQVRIEPGHMAASVFDFVSYPYTHSLALSLLWGVLFGAVYYALRRERRGAWVVAALVPSHWLLDLFVHGPDLPIWPGGPKVGLGGWSSVPLTIALELAVFIPSLIIYVRTTTARDRIGRWAFVGYVVLLVLIYAAGLFGPPPADVNKMAWAALTMWLLVPWAAWFDRHRAIRS
jgi:hypothetical protein